MRSEASEALVQQQRRFESVAQSFETQVRDVNSVELAKERTELKAAAHREMSDEATKSLHHIFKVLMQRTQS
eukprot:3920091-Karenia_brevis.AAC.1